MSAISRKGLAMVAMLVLVYTTPVLSATSQPEQRQQHSSELHKSEVLTADSSVAEKSGPKINQDYVKKDELVFGWSDLSLGWVFGLALFGFIWMSNRSRV
jgi:hypothetical protein